MKASHSAIACVLLLTSALLAAGCVPAPDSTPAPSPSPVETAPAPTPTSSPVAAAEPKYESWMDAPRTRGDWRYRDSGGLKIAEFVGADGGVKFQMDCSPEIGMLLSSAVDHFNADSIQIRTETVDRMLPADAREGWAQAVVRPRDPLLDAMALTKGRFAVETPDSPTLYLPAWAEVTRVIEDCR